MSQSEKSSGPKTFRELAGMPAPLKIEQFVLGDCFFFDPYIQAKQLREQREALVLRATMQAVELETQPEQPQAPVEVQYGVVTASEQPCDTGTAPDLLKTA